jgi:hypothetical protein
MSAALGQDLQGSIIMIGKALNDPIQGVTALRRVGVSFTQSQMEMIQSLVDSNQTLEAQKLILGELQTEFGGAAEAMGDTFTGQVNKLKVAFGNLGEAIGTKMLPGITAALGGLGLLIDAITYLINLGNQEPGDQVSKNIWEMADAVTGATVAYAHNTGAVKEGGVYTGVYGEQVWKAKLATEVLTAELEAQTEAVDKAAEAEEAYREGMSELEALIGGKLGPEVEDYNQSQGELAKQMADVNAEIDKMLGWGYSETGSKVQGLRDKYGELAQEYQTNAAEHRDATNRIIFDIAQQQLALSGLSPELQLGALEEMAKQLGIIDLSSQSAAVAIQAVASATNEDNANNVGDALAYIAQASADGVVSAEELKTALDILDGTKVVITYEYHSTGSTGLTSDAIGYAEGGDFWVNRPTVIMVGEGGKPEHVTVTPEGEQGPGGTGINIIQNFYGSANPEQVGAAASNGVLEAARRIGVR